VREASSLVPRRSPQNPHAPNDPNVGRLLRTSDLLRTLTGCHSVTRGCAFASISSLAQSWTRLIIVSGPVLFGRL
jgi:hypothetical protein